MELLEEEYKTQQIMLINHTSKYETLNHLLNQIVIKEENRDSINNYNNLEQYKDCHNTENNQIKTENQIENNYLKSEDYLSNEFKENDNQITNLNAGSVNNNINNSSMESGNSNKKKKKFIYTKFNSSKNLNCGNINCDSFDKKMNNNNNFNCDFENSNQKDNINFETNKESFENNLPCNNFNNNSNFEENQKVVYEKIETSEKFDLEEIKSYEFLLVDLIKFPQLLLEKITNGKQNLYKGLTQDYLREKFSKTLGLVKFTRQSFNTQNTSYSKNNSCCSEMNNSILISNDEELKKNQNSINNNINFKKIKFSNKILNHYSKKNNNSGGENFDNNLNVIGIDEAFLLDLIIKDLVLMTNIKYEKIERVINLLIKINYINKNINLREEFIFKEYPQNKKFLMDKILYIEKRIEAKYEKIKTMNLYIKKTESKLNEIYKILNKKKNELEENKNYLRNFESEINSMRENEESLKAEINKLTKEEQNVENEFKKKISEIEKHNKKLEAKVSKKNIKLRELNEIKKKNGSDNINRNSQSNENNNNNPNNTFKNNHLIGSRKNNQNEIRDDENHYEKEQVLEENFNSTERKNRNNRNNKVDGNNNNSSSSSINKYKRNRTNNLSNGINISNSNSNLLYGSPNPINHRSLNPNNRRDSNDFREENNNHINNNNEFNDHDQNEDGNQNKYANRNFNENNRNEEINYDYKNPNKNENQNSKKRKSSETKRFEKERCTTNRMEFRVNNNTYTKYQYPNENKLKNNREVSFDSSNFGNKGFKKYYLFEEKNNQKQTIKSNSKNRKSSVSSKKSKNENLANYSRSPKNFIEKSLNSMNKPSNTRHNNFNDNNYEKHDYNVNYQLRKSASKSNKNSIENKNKNNIYLPNRRINPTCFAKEIEICSEYIDPELQKKLNDNRNENKLSDSRRKNNYPGGSEVSSESGSRKNSQKRSQSKNSKERTESRKFNTLTSARNYNKQISNFENYGNRNFELNENNKIVKNNISEKENIYQNTHDNHGGFVNDSNVPHTSFRRFRNPSYVKVLNQREMLENLEKDKTRYVITKNTQDENTKNFNEEGYYDSTNYNYPNTYFNENPVLNNDLINQNEVSRGSNDKNIEGDYYYNCNQDNRSNISNEFAKSKASSGAAYIRKNNSKVKNSDCLYYENISEKQNYRMYDNESISSSISAREIKLEKTTNQKVGDTFDLDNKHQEDKYFTKSPIKSPSRINSLVGETKNLIYGNSNKKPNINTNNFNTSNNSKTANRNFSNFSSNDFSNNSFTNKSRLKPINFSNFNTTANSNRNCVNLSATENIPSNLKMSIENSRRTIPINNTEYEISKVKSLRNDDYNENKSEIMNKHKQQVLDIPKYKSNQDILKQHYKSKEKFEIEKHEKIDLLSLNYIYELTQRSTINTNNETENSGKKAKFNHTENVLRHYKNKSSINNNDNNNQKNQFHTSSRYNLQTNQNKNLIKDRDASFESVSIYNSNLDKTIKLSDNNENFSAYNSLNARKSSKYNSLSKPRITSKSKDYQSPGVENNFNKTSFNSDFDCFSFNEKIFLLEQGCILFKRNNYFGSKNFNKISSNIFYSSEFNPLDYGYKKFFCGFDVKRNKINFTKEDNYSDKKISEIYIASLTSYKVPQYTKNLVFVKQVYKKYLKSFDSLDQMDEYIENNMHFLVNLYYNNCKDKEIKFDNRLYSKQFRRELLDNKNFVVYLNLLSENTRIELMFLEYKDFKTWINGLQELISLKNC